MSFIREKNQTQNLSNYSKLVTAGNDPKLSCRMAYSQNIRTKNALCLRTSTLISPILYLHNFIFQYDSAKGPIIFTIDAQSNSNGYIIYTSSDVNILLFQGNTGIVLGTGQVTITATQQHTSLYRSASTTAIATITSI